MSNEQVIFSRVDDGGISTQALGAFYRGIRIHNGKMVKVTISEHKPRRSNNQNAFYWSSIVPPLMQMFREFGNSMDAEMTHEYLKEHVGALSEVVIGPDGKRRPVVRSTASLTKPEFEEYIEKVRVWAAEWGVVLPFPNEHLIGPPGEYDGR